MKTLLEQVASKCPNAKIIAGGYSQGTAVTARSIEKLSPAVRNRILGVVLFGYTQNKQLNGGVPGLPQDRVKVFCNVSNLREWTMVVGGCTNVLVAR